MIFMRYVGIGLLLNMCGFGLSHILYDRKTQTVLDKSELESVRIKVMGDWGGIPFFPFYSPFEKVTANRMMKHANNDSTDFVMALGDNFYYNGVENEFDSRFKSTFENVFNDPQFMHIPWYVLAGNHDHYGNITGELAYSAHSQRWIYPSLWYTVKVMRPSLNITIVMVDTVTLCGNTLFDEAGSQPDGKIDKAAESDQLEFIEKALKDNRDQYILVAGHFPVWSIAEHGPTQCLIDKLKPLLEKYRVSAYLCGHDHNLQHIRESNSSVEYFLSGAVDVVDPNKEHEDSVPKDSLQFYWANILGLGGYASIEANNQSLAFSFHSAVGDELYSYKVPPRK